MYDAGGTPKSPSTGRNCNFDSAPFVSLFPGSRNTNVFSQFTFQLTPQAQLFAEGLWAQNVVTEAYQPSPIRIAFLQTDNAFAGSGVDPALLIFPGNPNYPSAWLQSHGLAAMDGKPLAVSADVPDRPAHGAGHEYPAPHRRRWARHLRQGRLGRHVHPRH